MSNEIGDASPQVSHTATYAYSRGTLVSAMAARVSSAANPA
jgi:hypothetical protein